MRSRATRAVAAGQVAAGAGLFLLPLDGAGVVGGVAAGAGVAGVVVGGEAAGAVGGAVVVAGAAAGAGVFFAGAGGVVVAAGAAAGAVDFCATAECAARRQSSARHRAPARAIVRVCGLLLKALLLLCASVSR